LVVNFMFSGVDHFIDKKSCRLCVFSTASCNNMQQGIQQQQGDAVKQMQHARILQ
jgi:hypothetical protein